MKNNQFGICEWCMPCVGAEAIRRAGAVGFDGIQLTERGGYEAGHPLLAKDVQREYRRAADEAGVRLQALHLWSLCRLASMVHPVDSPAGRVATESIAAAVEICEALDIPAIMLTSGFLCNIKNETDFEVFGRHLKMACQLAGEKGIQIVFESALPARDILRMQEEVGGGLMACYDTFNPLRFHLARPEAEIPLLGREAIHHFHLKDGPADMVGCSLLGQGVGGFDAVARAIGATGFTGWFITENYYDAYPLKAHGSFDELARRDLDTMRRTLGG